jgi:hypothetical protein
MPELPETLSDQLRALLSYDTDPITAAEARSLAARSSDDATHLGPSRPGRPQRHAGIRPALAWTLGILVLIALGIGVSVSFNRTSHAKPAGGPTTTSAANGGVVPWVDRSVSSSLLTSLLPKPLPSTPPQTNAPACLSQSLSLVGFNALGLMQDDGIVIGFRNDGRAACIERATPRVEAMAPGQVTVVATTDPVPSYGEIVNIPPGGSVMMQVHAPVACNADPGGGNQGLPVYSTLAIYIPGGAPKVQDGLHLTFQCGMSNTPFWSGKPPPVYPANPLVDLVPQLQLPTTVKAGSTLDYRVVLSNPENRPVELSPCPVYLEYSSIPRTKLTYRLNCGTVHAIPAHGREVYQMEMALPASASPGQTEVWWTLFGVSTPIAKGQFQVG